MQPRLFAWFSRWNAVQRTFAGTCLVILLLEAWRPCFFLTDDNMTNWLPLVVGIGRRLWHGQALGYEPYLFGGYNLLHDPNDLFNWNPLTFLFSCLANTSYYYLLPDAFCIVHLLVGTSAFAFLLVSLKRWYKLEISANRIVFLSISFVFSQYALTVGASWLSFLANQAALPFWLLGLLHPRRDRGIAFLVLGLLYTMTMGHLSPFLFTVLFFGVFSVAWSWKQKSAETLLRYGAALLLAGLLLSPLLLQALQGFKASSRSTSMSIHATSVCSVGPIALVMSFFFGYFGVKITEVTGAQSLWVVQAFASCAASFSVFSRLFPRSKQAEVREPANSQDALLLEKMAVGMLLLIALFIWRPYWLGAILHALPLYKSLRWPFREIVVLLFWAHLWLALRPLRTSARANLFYNLAGGAIYLSALLFLTPWSFAPMRIDRNLLMSGEANAFWRKMAPKIGKDNQFFVIMGPTIVAGRLDNVPFSLLGAYNYPAIYGVKGLSGYTSAGLSNVQLDGKVPNHWSGTFSVKDGDALLAKYPRLRALELVSLHPLRIDFRYGTHRERVQVPPLDPNFPAR